MTRSASFVDFPDGRIAYWRLGDPQRQSIILTHGGALDHESMAALGEELAVDHDVLLWDMPGHGLSQPMPRDFRIAHAAKSLACLQDHLEIASAVHIGFSFGGPVVQTLAKIDPGKVGTLVNFACAAINHGPKIPAPALVAEMMTLPARLKSIEKLASQFAADCVVDPRMKQSLAEQVKRCGKSGYRDMLRALLKEIGRSPDFHFSGPQLVIFGSDDVFLNKAGVQKFVDGWRNTYPGIDIIEIENAGHCANLDQPATFVKELRGWMTNMRLFH